MSDPGFTSKIDDLRKAGRDTPDAGYRRPDDATLTRLLARMDYFRLRRHAQFWGETAQELAAAMEMLVTGLHAAYPGFLFALRGREGAIECWFGAERKGETDTPPLPEILSAAFRSAAGETKPPADLLFPDAPMMRITGAPSPPFPGAPMMRVNGAPSPPPRAGVPLQSLCDGLFGAEWLYLVHAKRRPHENTLNEVHWWDTDLSEAGRPSRLAGQEGHDHSLGTYLKLLEAMRKRGEDSILCGSWDVETWFSAPRTDTLLRGSALLSAALGGAESLPDPVRANRCIAGAKEDKAPEPWPLSSKQLAVLTCPPGEAYPGYEIIPHVRFASQTIPDTPQERAKGPARRLEIGFVQHDGRDTGNMLSMPLDDLTSHGIIAGVTGSGKTNTCFQILAQLDANDVPFMVVEAAKSEYRELIADPRFKIKPTVFTVGNETVNPLRLNPFAFPDGILLQTHIDYLKQAFAAAFEMWHPLPHVLERSLEGIYIDRGWDLTTSTNDRSAGYDGPLRFPTLADLERKAISFIAGMGYSEKLTQDILGAFVSRLGQLRGAGGKGPMLNTRASTPDHVLFEKNCIIELEALASDDEKAFLIGLLLIRLKEYHESRRQRVDAAGPPGALRHLTLIEEAHRLLKNVPTSQGGEGANPRGQAIEFFSNLLAEIRAFGEGVLMAEQIPVKLVPDAIKNTNLKIIHRLLPRDDREAVGATMNLAPPQIEQLARLQKGQAIVYAERLLNPVLLYVPLQKVKESFKIGRTSLPTGNRFDQSAVSTMMEGRQKRNDRGYRRVLSAYTALFYALAEPVPDLGAVLEQLGRLREAAANFMGPSFPAGVIFMTLLDEDIDIRADVVTPTASFVMIRDVLDCAVAVLDMLPEGGGVSENLAPALRDFAGAVARLHRVPPEPFPFPACDICDKPCLYRPHVIGFLWGLPEERQAFNERLGAAAAAAEKASGRAAEFDPAPWLDLCRQALTRIDVSFKDATEKTRQGAAYCYAVHQICGPRGLEGDIATDVAYLFHDLLQMDSRVAPAADVSADFSAPSLTEAPPGLGSS